MKLSFSNAVRANGEGMPEMTEFCGSCCCLVLTKKG